MTRMKIMRNLLRIPTPLLNLTLITKMKKRTLQMKRIMTLKIMEMMMRVVVVVVEMMIPNQRRTARIIITLTKCKHPCLTCVYLT